MCDLEFRITHSLANRWEMFSSVLLEINHRQGNDKTYADLLNRLRIGKETEEDIELLSSRIRKLPQSLMQFFIYGLS